MQFEFEQNFWNLHILPMFSVTAGECSNPECKTLHTMVVVGWLFWTLQITFES